MQYSKILFIFTSILYLSSPFNLKLNSAMALATDCTVKLNTEKIIVHDNGKKIYLNTVKNELKKDLFEVQSLTSTIMMTSVVYSVKVHRDSKNQKIKSITAQKVRALNQLTGPKDLHNSPSETFEFQYTNNRCQRKTQENIHHRHSDSGRR